MRRDPEAFQKALDEYRKSSKPFDDAYAVFDDETISAVDAFREKNELVYPGNPRGLVDDRLVGALKSAYRQLQLSDELAGR